ncbi:MAG: hypothetical protein WA761_06525 [Thermoplasmata archaeon]
MSESAPAERDRPWAGEAVHAALYLLPAILLALVNARSAILALVGIGATVAVGLVVRRQRRLPRRVGVGMGVIGAGSVVVSVTAVPSALAALLCGASALLAVAWMTSDPWEPRPITGRIRILWLPSLSFFVAFVSSIALPAGQQTVGLAAGLLALVFLMLAFLYRQSASLGEERAETS